ncbi:hypothetical protein [Candidatus Ruthturnera calyptogenae]|uniref:hypothetical protein n=1 Tax=Candidatus Ruthturnera calyptogenae TaxID=386487 RepID=UPI0002FD433A|nr:hypothetical protein [Candidatus Ruthturnera calyptogenae]
MDNRAKTNDIPTFGSAVHSEVTEEFSNGFTADVIKDFATIENTKKLWQRMMIIFFLKDVGTVRSLDAIFN